ncbi:spore germination protein [Paenibacillus filicis]|uniref:Spore germination protein n=1 Tax=Paenibacillus filicis TaxID=669464 RepID=A0ABU9DEQ8_9BACL
MFRWLLRSKYRSKPSSRPARVGPPPPPVADPLSYIRQELKGSMDVKFRHIAAGSGIPCTMVYIESIIDGQALQEYVITPLIEWPSAASSQELLSSLGAQALPTLQTRLTTDMGQAVNALLKGAGVLIVDKEHTVCLFPLTSYSQRAVTESQNEMVIVGPQEAFVENLNTNLSLLRHKVKHPSFKTLEYMIGTYTQTRTCVFYMEGLCDPQVLKEVTNKLEQIRMDGVLGVSYIGEHLDTCPKSPFPTAQYTERPDTLAASLLEGRIGVMVEGTPQTLIVPVTFFSLMQSPEDYFQGSLAATWIRWVRFFFVVVSFLLPSIYIAITTFHPEMIPSNLLVTISAARESIPFPALAEVIIMELTFEALREAGIRIPRPLGQTVSIIGAIVIGQAAVQAGIVSAPTVIVVSITGIASFIIPHFELGLAFRLLRFPLLLLGGTIGLLGIITGLCIMFFHLVTVHSFGVPYMHPLAPLVFKDWKDVFIRARWTNLQGKPDAFAPRRKDGQDTA